MTKLELSKRLLSVDASVDGKTALEVVNVVLDTIKKYVKHGHRAEFRKFGSFIPVTRSGYETTNPATGKRIMLKPRALMRFRASQSLNENMNNYEKVVK